MLSKGKKHNLQKSKLSFADSERQIEISDSGTVVSNPHDEI